MSKNSQSEAKPANTSSKNLSAMWLVNICAAAMLICFFLPWTNFLLGKLSGFDFAKDGGKFLFLWSIPIFGALTILASAIQRLQKIVALLTGVLPFVILGYGLSQVGGDLMRILDIGAYAGLALGLLLFIVAFRLK